MQPRFMICRASAGSGKTYTLVRQYIETAICVPETIHDRYRHILAITFTNKAANGMKARIMKTLTLISDWHSGEAMDDDDREKTAQLVNEMAGHLAVDNDEICVRCTRLLSEILHNYSQFSVFTIDSFVHRIVQSFAHDLRLPINFEVALDSQEITKNTVEELLLMAGQEQKKELTEVLCAFTEQNMHNDRSYKITSQIENLAVQIFREEAPGYLEKLKEISLSDFLQIQKTLEELIDGFESELSKAAQTAVDARKAKGLELSDFKWGKSSFFTFFEKLASGDYSVANEIPQRTIKVFDEGDAMYVEKAPAHVQEAIDSIADDLMKAYKSITSLIDNSLKNYNTWKVLESNIYGLALLGIISDIKENYYAENGIVHISEFNKRISEQVVNEPAPFIYERIGGRYHNYLIDEFQDTSKMQWLNFLPLIDEAVGHDFGRCPAVGTESLVVGDGKQAIYRFRQGDVRQFMMLPKVESNMHGKLLEKYSGFSNLETNYRTLANIVYFNNYFFKWAHKTRFINNDHLQKLYIDHDRADKKHPALWQYPKNSGGYVQVTFCNTKQGKENQYDRLYGPILEAIREQHSKGFKYSDIYILARTNKILVEISNYIVSNSAHDPVPVVSNESFILSNSQSVLFLQAMLTYINDTNNSIAALRAANLALQIGLLDTVPGDSIAREKDQPLWLLRENKFDLSALFKASNIDFQAERYQTMSLYDCCESMVRLFHLDKDSAYIATFLNTAAKYSQRHHGATTDFITYLEKNISNISTSASASDAVQLMTVHKAKGLEAPIVIYALKKERPQSSQLWTEVPSETFKLSDSQSKTLPVAFVKQPKNKTQFSDTFDKENILYQMDEMNVLYVAMTRPEKKLMLFCEDNITPNGTDSISLLADFMNSGEMTNYLHDKDFDHPTLPDSVKCIHDEYTRTYHFGTDFECAARLRDPEQSSNQAILPDRKGTALSTDEIKSNTAKKQSNNNNSFELETLNYPEWQNRIVISTPNASLLSTLNSQRDGQLTSPESPHHDRQFGILVHDLMAHIQSRNDVQKVVEGYCSANHLDEATAAEIEQRILKMVDDPANAEYFNPNYRVVCELSIVDGNETFRPDRVVFAPDHTWVVDYKTGSFNADSHKQYEQQVALYVQLVAAMGHPNVEGAVIYL